MKLYYAPGTCAVACWIALRWADAEFEVSKADYGSAEFRRVNPLVMVPALDIGGPRAMTQADAILNYIADCYPAARLGAGNSLLGRFEFNETMSFLSGDFHPAFWPYFTPQRFTTDLSEASLANVRTASYARIDRVMQHLDRLIGDSAHVHDNRRTVADAYAYVMVRWTSKQPRSWKNYANIARFYERMEKDSAVSDVMSLSVA